MPKIQTCIRKARSGGRILYWASNVLFILGLAFMVDPEGYSKARHWRDTHVVVSINTSAKIRDLSANLTSYDFEQIKCLAVNSYFEARGEGQRGMEAVDDVVLNRVRSGKYPDGVCQVVYQSRFNQDGSIQKDRCQFSWYCDGKKHTVTDPIVYQQAYQLAYNKYVYRPVGLLADKTSGADHYHNETVSPHWGLALVTKIGHHLFYR